MRANTDHDRHDANLLAAYLDGHLTEEERSSFTAHLAECEICRGALALYARGAAAGREETPQSLSSPINWRSPRAWLPLAATLLLTTSAALYVLRTGPHGPGTPTPTEATRPVPVPRVTTAPETPRAPTVSTGPRSGTAPRPRGSDSTTRGAGLRQVAGKTFKLIDGEWVDAAYDPFALQPEVEVASPEQRASILRQHRQLARYASLGARVLVVYEGTVYRFAASEVSR